MKPGRKRLLRFLSLAAVVVVSFLIHEVLAMIAVVGIAYVLLWRRITPEHKRLLLALAVTGFCGESKEEVRESEQEDDGPGPKSRQMQHEPRHGQGQKEPLEI